eukprot:7353838-Alexandrium_andersonii.AAC.1
MPANFHKGCKLPVAWPQDVPGSDAAALAHALEAYREASLGSEVVSDSSAVPADQAEVVLATD